MLLGHTVCLKPITTKTEEAPQKETGLVGLGTLNTDQHWSIQHAQSMHINASDVTFPHLLTLSQSSHCKQTAWERGSRNAITNSKIVIHTPVISLAKSYSGFRGFCMPLFIFVVVLKCDTANTQIISLLLLKIYIEAKIKAAPFCTMGNNNFYASSKTAQLWLRATKWSLQFSEYFCYNEMLTFFS